VENGVRAAVIVTPPKAGNGWSAIKERLETFDRAGLLSLLADLYRATAENRRFLESRLLKETGAIETYRRAVVEAIYPDPLSRRPISVRAASATITQYRRATGDPVGTTDLMLSFVEAGTEQSVDLGYGDDGYLSALERKLDAIAAVFDDLPPNDQAKALRRLSRVRSRAHNIGWGYGDYVADVVQRIERRATQAE
jgi:hypothetical protein